MLSTTDIRQSAYLNSQESIPSYGPIYNSVRSSKNLSSGSSTILAGNSSNSMISDVINLDPSYGLVEFDRPIPSKLEVPPEIQKYMDHQIKFGFTYRWQPNLYHQPEAQDEIVGVFEPSYTGNLSPPEVMTMLTTYPEIAQAIVVKSNYHFELKPFQHTSPYLQNKYKLIQELGRGAFGVTYLAKDVLKDRSVAIKIIDISRLEGRGYSRRILNDEIETLSKLSDNGGSEYIVTYYESFEENYEGAPSMFIVSEYIPGITLTNFIQLHTLEPTVLWPLYLQLLLGLNYIHKCGYAHRDIKPDNIMVTPDHNIKYIDFGLSCFQQCRIDACTNNCRGPHGTISYLPPELLTKSNSSPTFQAYMAHDIWSIGLTMYQMANQGSLPRSEQTVPNPRSKNLLTVSFPVISNYQLDRDDRTNQYLQAIIVQDPTARPDIDGLLQLLIKKILQRVWI